MAPAIARACLLVGSGGLLCAVAIAPDPAARPQDSRGAALYAERCAGCHGATMRGGDDGMALTGARFARNWNGKSIFALFERIRITMPQDDPGTLRPDQALDLTAVILSANGIPPPAADCRQIWRR